MRYVKCILLSMLFLFNPMAALAGDLDSPAAPTDAGSAMFTLEDIYNRLNNGSAGSKRLGAFTEPLLGPTAGTGHTLDEVMSKAPSVDDINGAGVADVLADKTFWGLSSGNWGVKTGTVTAGSDVSGADGSKTFTIPDGLYSGSKTAIANDADLLAGNIKDDVQIFGVTGTFPSDGTAATGDVKTGSTFYTNSATKLTGTGTKTLSSDNDTVSAGYYEETTLSAVDADLLAENIKKDVNIFGVAGDSNVVNTSSGDAGSGEILSGKKAWVDGSEVTGSLTCPPASTGDAVFGDVLETKTFSNASGTGHTGTMPNQGAKNYTPSAENQTITAGYYNGSGHVVGDADLLAENIKKDVNIFGKVGTYSGSAAVAKTGQTPTAPLNPAPTGSDGDLQKGVTWPNPRFSDNSDGTVTDNLTGLIWLKHATCFGQRSWANALSDCNSLASGSCGLSDGSIAGDWRLPNIMELLSLMDYAFSGPPLPNTAGTGKWSAGDAFTNVIYAPGFYWTSSTCAHYAAGLHAWKVDMYHGRSSDENLKTELNYVWPVRGGQ